jgi:tetratricopeptide (TPR) repeat protein
VRFEGGRPGEWETEACDVVVDEAVDVAAVVVDPAGGDPEVVSAPFGRLGVVAAVVPVLAVGFPRFKLRSGPVGWYRDSHQATGSVAPLSNRKEDSLEVTVAPPARDPDPDVSPWEGMSGAALWAGSRIVGVVTAHHRSDGLGRLAATPLQRVGAGRLAAVVGLPRDPHDLPDVLHEPASELLATAYHLQVAEIAPPVLHGRAREIEELTAFCFRSEWYAWWQADAWAGKTALMAWFALHPPPKVEVVSFFVAGGLAGESDSEAFLEALAEQLTVLAGRPLGTPVTTVARRGRLLELITAASERGRSAGRRLLLLVDGLDEDTGPAMRKASIASLLPRRPIAGVHVLVTSRSGRDLPLDVPADHPLRQCVPRSIDSAEEARHDEQSARWELAGQIGSGALQEDVLGLIAASGGGVNRDDLAELTERSPFAITELLRGRFGHSIRCRTQRLPGSLDTTRESRGYLFAHETLRRTAEVEFGSALVGYRERLHRWGERYRGRGWPADTPLYLLRDYPRMLAAVGDADRLSELACDRSRHERVRDLTGGDALALDEIGRAQELGLCKPQPNLEVATRLALHREELTWRNAVVPVSLPTVWALVGHADRAAALARSLPGRSRQGEALENAALAAAAVGRPADAEALLEVIEDAQRRDRALAAVAGRTARIDLTYAERLADRLNTTARRTRVRAQIAALRAAAEPDHAAMAHADPPGALIDLAVALAEAGHHSRAAAIVMQAGTGRRGAEARARTACALAQAGAAADAERVAATIRAPLLKARALAATVGAAVAAGDLATVNRLTADLYEAVDGAPDPGAASDVVLSLATELLRRGRAGCAAELARRADALLDRVSGRTEWVSGRRAITRAIAGDLAGAIAVVQRLDNPDHQVQTTQQLAVLVDSAGGSAWAPSLIGGIPGVRGRVEALTALARAALDRGDRERAIGLATEAERLAGGVGDPTRLAAASDHVVDGLLLMGDIDEAIALADRITESDRRESALARVASAVAADRPAEAQKIASGLAPHRRGWVLARLAELQSHGGAHPETHTAVEKALAALVEIARGLPRVLIQVRLARVLAAIDRVDEAEALLCRASDDTDHLTDPDHLVRAWALLGAVSAEHQRPDQSAVFARRLGETFEQVSHRRGQGLRARAAECLAEAGYCTAAQEHADRVDNPADRVRALCAVARRTDAGQAATLLSEAAALVPKITAIETRNIALARLADAGTALAVGAGARPDSAWTTQPLAELLVGDSWSRAAPALARVDPAAFHVLRDWVINHLDQTSAGQ